MDTGFINRRDSEAMNRENSYLRENKDAETIFRLRDDIRKLEGKLKIAIQGLEKIDPSNMNINMIDDLIYDTLEKIRI